MLKRIKHEEKLNIEKLNNMISLLDKILRIAYIFIIIVAIFLVIKLCQELNLKSIVLVILKTLSPLFIGLFLAWLFAPIVKKLNKRGIKRSVGTTIVYILFIGFLVLLVGSIIPVLTDQINDFVSILPSIFDSLKDWINKFFDNLNNIEGLDAITLKNTMFDKIENYGTALTTLLPGMTVNFMKTLFSGIGSFVVGLVIGFYLLIGFDNAGELLITLLPKKYQRDARELGNEMNNSLRKFVNGAIIDAIFVFIIISIAFFAVGLKAPILFGLFCAITNVIPYAGPYIGGVPAVIVGFSQNLITGILVLICIVIIQFLEGNFLQPVILSKTTKLHPVTIMVGLLIFGHFFGIFGMLISTPVIAVCKSVMTFFVEKYEIDLF